MDKKTTKEGSVTDLHFDDKNFNAHTEFGMGRLEKSLRKFGAGRSILVDKDNRIIAGNGIIETAVNVGLHKTRIIETTGDEIVVVKRTDVSLDSKQGREMALADNATSSADLAWDYSTLSEVTDAYSIDTDEWGVSLAAPELELEQEEGETKEDEFDEEDNNMPKRCSLGDVWILGNHRMMCGDSTSPDDVNTLLGGVKSVDMLMTDPPYGISADKMKMGTGKQDYKRGDWDSAQPDIMPLLNYAKYSCVWGGNYFADVLPVNNYWLCWHKNNDSLSFSEFELAWTNFGRNCRHITHNWGREKNCISR